MAVAQPKKDIALTFCVRVVCMNLDYIYSDFFGKLEKDLLSHIFVMAILHSSSDKGPTHNSLSRSDNFGTSKFCMKF